MRGSFVQRLRSLSDLSETEQTALEKLPEKPRPFAARDTIAAAGDTDRLYLVLTGIAGRSKLHLNGARRMFSFALPGDLGDIGVLETGSRELHLRALTPCTVASLSRQARSDAMEAHPGIACAVWRLGMTELRIAREWLVNDSRPAEKRTAHLFCELLVRLQAVGLARENSFGLKLPQTDLAEALGLSTVHMNRVLQALRASGLIDLQRQIVRVPNVTRLQAFAEFDPAYLQLGGSRPQAAARLLQQKLEAEWSNHASPAVDIVQAAV